ncbi:MAG TPA: carboxypeptidase-like regulatory domain-containing protein, partial [Candidatus Thermoplasmatota archaeon]
MPRARVLVLLLLISGCLSAGEDTTTIVASDETAPPQAVAEFDESTGALEGVVTSDSLEPIGAVDITLDGSVSTSTDPFGHFAFSHLAPGTYSLAAQAPNYAPALTEVDVEPGRITTTNLLLVPIPGTQPYSTTIIHQGFWDCSVAAIVGVPNCLNMTGLQKIGYGFDIQDEWRTSQIE